MNIKVDSTGIRVNERKYSNTALDEYNMVDCKRVGTPGQENENLSKEDCPADGSEEQRQMQGEEYRGLIGNLNYLAISSRPDIAFIAHTLSCFVNSPGRKHWAVGKRVLR